VEVGLYTCVVPLVAYAVLGDSGPMSVTTTSTVALLCATTLAGAGLASDDAPAAVADRAGCRRPPCPHSTRLARSAGRTRWWPGWESAGRVHTTVEAAAERYRATRATEPADEG
jgi:hypothetical protein